MSICSSTSLRLLRSAIAVILLYVNAASIQTDKKQVERSRVCMIAKLYFDAMDSVGFTNDRTGRHQLHFFGASLLGDEVLLSVGGGMVTFTSSVCALMVNWVLSGQWCAVRVSFCILMNAALAASAREIAS